MKALLPATQWHAVVLAAWLRRVITHEDAGHYRAARAPDYHPAKAAKIYNRYKHIIDLYA